MEFSVVFHVQEEDERSAQEWRTRALQIFQAHRDELVAPRSIKKPDGTDANVGDYCPGHVLPPQSTSERSPAAVLRMGPRE